MRVKIKATFEQQFPKLLSLLRLLKFFHLKGLATELETMFNGRIDDNVDIVTGLAQRRYFMKELTQEVARQFPDLENGILPEESSIVVLVADMAFLNFFNRTSHRLGDEVLSRVGMILGQGFEDSVVGRVGGDEFAVYTKGSVSDAVHKKIKVQSRIQEQPLNILDIEHSAFEDIKRLVDIHPLPEERRVKFIVGAFTDIAMARAQISKYYTRIDFLIKMYLNDRDGYEEIITFARKGAGNITDKEIADFSRRFQNGEVVALECLNYALKAKEYACGDGEYERAIHKVAKTIFD